MPDPARYQPLRCADFPDLECCDGCHIDWEALPEASERYRHTHLPTVCYLPDAPGYALVCCEVAERLAARGWRALRVADLEQVR